MIITSDIVWTKIPGRYVEDQRRGDVARPLVDVENSRNTAQEVPKLVNDNLKQAGFLRLFIVGLPGQRAVNPYSNKD